MEANIKHYISAQPFERQAVLTDVHNIIIKNDKTVVPVVEPMMGKEMIVYKGKGFMKYGLSSMKNYMSLHIMPIYGSTTLHSKYKSLLNKANFQKGCINFGSADEMPLDIIKDMITDCSKIDLLKIREEYLAKNKRKSK
jgi:hypothetical protein